MQGEYQAIARLSAQHERGIVARIAFAIGLLVGEKRGEELGQLLPLGVEVLFEKRNDLVVPDELERSEAFLAIGPRDIEQVASASPQGS
jgi:hypothetical protein